ncbi:MAG TPA: GntR family transcriptional regulator [Pyrinomonadaceae bacterium]|nr:GntR family transcriptional regulator [Pyrinomonadaceae bacterium]
MQFLFDKKHKDSLFEQAFLQLVTALHMGKIGAGDRLPSVRQMALRNNINHKTAFSIYQRLNLEGYITLRRGSGAYVSDIDHSDLEQAYCLSLFKLIKSNFAEADRLKINPRDFTRLSHRYLNKSPLKSVKVAVIECNDEQIGVFAAEISNKLGVAVSPLLLSRIEAPDRATHRLLSRADLFTTTHFHFKQVKALLESYHKKLLQLRLNPTFVPSFVNAASEGSVLMIVSNVNYFEAFSQSLLNVGTPRSVVERISAVDDRNLEQVRAQALRADTVYVSPICDPRVKKCLPPHCNLLTIDTTLSDESMERLEAFLLFRSRL